MNSLGGGVVSVKSPPNVYDVITPIVPQDKVFVVGDNYLTCKIRNVNGKVFSVDNSVPGVADNTANSPTIGLHGLHLISLTDHAFYAKQIQKCVFGILKTETQVIGKFGMYFEDSLQCNIDTLFATNVPGQGTPGSGLAIVAKNGVTDPGNFEVGRVDADGTTDVGVLLQGASSASGVTESGKVNLNHFRYLILSSQTYMLRMIKAKENLVDFVDLESGVKNVIAISLERVAGSSAIVDVSYNNKITHGFISVTGAGAKALSAASDQVPNYIYIPRFRINGAIQAPPSIWAGAQPWEAFLDDGVVALA